MFNLQQYSAKIAVITDRGEKLTYAELYTKVARVSTIMLLMRTFSTSADVSLHMKQMPRLLSLMIQFVMITLRIWL